jgi:DNA-binding CsgD family transcriptional regulator
MVCEDKTSEEIGKILNMGVRNVESLRAKILKKMGVKTTAGWVIYAIKNGLYHIDL